MESEFDEGDRKRKRLIRIAVAVFSVIVLTAEFAALIVAPRVGAYGLFSIVGVVFLVVYTFDVPEYLFSGFYAAKRKVQGVEHAGRHDWYGFHGTRIRAFFDDHRRPWLAAKEIAHILALGDVPEAFRGYRSSEFGRQPFADDEFCLSEAGLRRLLKSSQHPEAHPMLLWLERDVLFPLRERERRATP